MRAARTSCTLLAATDAPTPLPHTAILQSTLTAAMARAKGNTKVGIVISLVEAKGIKINDIVAGVDKVLIQRLLQFKASMVGSDTYFHFGLRISFPVHQ